MKKNKIKILSSWDDYCLENIKLAELLLKYKISGLFFVECGHKIKINQIKKLAEMGMEIGSHTFSHPIDLKLLDARDLTHEIIESRELLRRETGQEIDWLSYPHGRYDERVKSYVKAAGYKYARTTNLGEPFDKNPYDIYTDFHCYPHRKEYGGKKWFEYGKDIIKIKTDESDMATIHLWGHGWELSKFSSWELLEELFKWIKDNFDIKS